MKTTTTAISKNGNALRRKKTPIRAGFVPSTPDSTPVPASSHPVNVTNSVAETIPSEPIGTNGSLLQACGLQSLVDSFVLAGDIARHSERTLATKRERLGRIVWFAQREGWQVVGVAKMRSFFAYLNHGHKEPERFRITGRKQQNSSDRVYTRSFVLATGFSADLPDFSASV